MQGFAACLLYLGLGASMLAGARLIAFEPAPGAEAADVPVVTVVPAAGAEEPDDLQVQALRLRERLELEATLASARPPVPLLRDTPLTPWVEPEPLGPGFPVSPLAAEAKRQRTPERAKAKIEEDGYRSVRMVEQGADGKWRAMAMRGNTEVAVLVDEKGNVSSE